MKNLTLDRTLKPGSKGRKVKPIQEWLGLNGFEVVIDGDFGPATERAVKRFQQRKRLGQTGTVNRKTFNWLIRPMTHALRPIRPRRRSLTRLVRAHGKAHLRRHPREIGGQNMGPWVRLYMKGNQGREWAWCAGFVSLLLKHAADTKGVTQPHPYTYWAPDFAATGREHDTFIAGPHVTEPNQIPPGTIFLVRRGGGWSHTGIVYRAHADGTFDTIEGNTNDDGSPEGYEVCRRTRTIRKQDFVLVRPEEE